MRYYLIYSLIINQKLIKFSKLIRELVGKIYFFSSKETNKVYFIKLEHKVISQVQ